MMLEANDDGVGIETSVRGGEFWTVTWRSGGVISTACGVGVVQNGSVCGRYISRLSPNQRIPSIVYGWRCGGRTSNKFGSIPRRIALIH